LELGQALIKELDLDRSVDTLSRWMAHHIAELIKAAETAKPEARPSEAGKCADAILRLWEHRSHFPDGKRPFDDLEPILRAIESLGPTNERPRYFPSARTAADETDQNAETRKWLELADGLDYSARILILHFITKAAQNALDKSKPWVALAEKAGFGDSIDLKIFHIIINERNLLKEIKPDDSVRSLLEDRIERLDNFIKLAESLVSDLHRQLKQAEMPKGDT
jgi:hypothetical protein